jgi:hypothetical protein
VSDAKIFLGDAYEAFAAWNNTPAQAGVYSARDADCPTRVESMRARDTSPADTCTGTLWTADNRTSNIPTPNIWTPNIRAANMRADPGGSPAFEGTTRYRRDSGFSESDVAAGGPAAEQPDEEALDPGSLIGARVAGARAILQETCGDQDDALLFAANLVHHKASADPDDADAQAASIALWRAEASAWADANGADAALDEETRLQAYIEQWSLALDPPVAPAFDDRREIAKRYVLERAGAGLSIAIASEPSPTPVPVEKLIGHFMNDPQVIKRYYSQFARYVESHLERFSKMSIIGEAAAIGISRFRLEQIPRRMWHIKDLSQFPLGAHRIPPGAAFTAMGRHMGASHVVEMPNGQFFHIDAAGGLQLMDADAVHETGRLRISAVLKARGITPNIGQAPDGPLAPDGRTAAVNTPRLAPATHEYLMASEPCTPVRLGTHLAVLRQDAIRAALAQWKEEKYLPSRAESVVRMIIPFSKLYHDMRWDPGYQVQFEDIAWDAAQLTLAVAGVALAAVGGPAGGAAALGVLRAAAAQGARAMIKAGVLSLMRRFSLKTFLVQGARELTDFVMPVFTATKILRGAARAAPAATRGLQAAMRRTDALVRSGNPKALLEAIYDMIAHSGSVSPSSTAEIIGHALEAAAERPIPAKVYRGQTGSPHRIRFYSTTGGKLSEQDMLAACIRHSAITGGSGGEVMSLSADRSVAVRFGKGRPQPLLFIVDTARGGKKFRRVEDILLNEGPRLVQEGKIRAGTLRSAILHAYMQEEKEIFYLGSEIPAAWIDKVKPLGNGAT